MYINFWYPICTTAELTAAAPVKARVLTLPFVAFRDADGQAHVLSDTCVHRGGALHKGKVVNGRLACPYHGWQFDGGGRCALIPSLGAGGQHPGPGQGGQLPGRSSATASCSRSWATFPKPNARHCMR